jgi:hypothetical protein
LINLNDYTSFALDHLARVGAHAVYVLRPAAAQKPIKISRTVDPQATLVEATRRSPVPVEVASLFWTCGFPLAERIDRMVRLELDAAGRRNENGWFNVTAQEAAELIERRAREMYPTVTSFLDHDGMVELIARRGKRMHTHQLRPQPRLATNPLFK